MLKRQFHHFSEEKVAFRQSAVVETAGRGKGEFPEPAVTVFKIEVGAHEWERFGEFFGIVE